jgi:hypothetical protein
MDHFIVEFEDGYELTIEGLDQEDAAITAELYTVQIGQDNHGPVVSVRLA